MYEWHIISAMEHHWARGNVPKDSTLKLFFLMELDGTARYADFLLAPADGFSQGFVGPLGKIIIVNGVFLVFRAIL